MKSLWRFFPWAIVAGIGLVVMVNGGMIYAAIDSFPGRADEEGFLLSNHYDAVLARAEHEASRGWSLVAQVDAEGRPVLTLKYRDGKPLRDASVTGLAERPLGARERHSLVFHESDAGRYVADAALPASGQWELTLSTSAEGHDVAATRRIIVQ